MRRTKIICTLGPNQDDEKIMRKMIENGMNVARFNFSHGTYEEHRKRFDLLKKLRDEMGIPVATMLDTKGPEIRTGLLTGGRRVTLKDGQKFILTIKEQEGNEKLVYVDYEDIVKDVKPQDSILIDDGLIELQVQKTDSTSVECVVVNGGDLGEKKGVNIPGVKIKLPALTKKDREDLDFGIKLGFDFISASFTRNADGIKEIKSILKKSKSDIRVIAKIENLEGINNIDSIIEASDGIMVARGDMGVEIPTQKVPFIQKTIIKKCNLACRSVITATQMLDSMIRNPRPTRAEVTDVANAVYDGTDAIMLSGETAMGKYPVETLNVMAKIAEESEKHLDHRAYRERQVSAMNRKNISNAVCYSAVATADDIGATAILAPSISGFTARMLSKWRPSIPIYGLTPNPETLRRMQMYWGVIPVEQNRASSSDELISSSITILKKEKYLKKEDLVVVTAGIISQKGATQKAAHTNIMQIEKVE